MPLMNAPNTPAIMTAIQTYMSSLTWTYNSVQNITFAQVQIEEIKDVTNVVAGGSACLEIYGTADDSQHKSFNGRIMDEQAFLLLALVSKDTPLYAQQIYTIRDALVRPFQIHATLGDAGNVYHSQIKPRVGKYVDIRRNEQWLRGYKVEILTYQEWQVPVPPGVIS